MPDFSLEGLSTLLETRIGKHRYTQQIRAALALAYRGHDGQFREHADPSAKAVPYIVHPVGVASLANEFLQYVELEDNFEDVISICLTHDLLEDTEIEVNEIGRTLSHRTAEVVLSLTKDSVSGELTREQRNERLLRKIIASGNTAMFVKICDHCHNISRPNQTPTRLLEKALRKGESNYLQFFASGRLAQPLKNVYLERLRQAEQALANTRRNGENLKKSRTLEEAISHCVLVSDKKVLEIHDISDVLLELTNAIFVKPVDIDSYLQQTIFELVPSMDQKSRAAIRKQSSQGRIDFSLLPKGVKRLLDSPVDLIYVVDLLLPSEAGPQKSLVIGVDTKSGPDWLGLEPLRVIVSYLSERMRFQDRNQTRALATELARLKLEMDMEDVQSLHLIHTDLQRLRRILDFGEFIRARAKQILEYTLVPENQDRDVPFIESRCKSPRAIARKMLSRGYSDFSKVDDIVGIRIVCLSLSEARNICRELKNIVPKNFVAQEINARGRRESSALVESKAGYKAFHLYFMIKSGVDTLDEVSCEFQVRTVFQDAWARVSRELAYKGRNRWEGNLSEFMKVLSRIRDDADALIDKTGR